MMNKFNGLAVWEEGPKEGIPVVLIHGFPMNHAMWDPQIKALASKYRVISYDVRGHGQSEAGDGQYTVEFFVDDLVAVLDGLKIQTAVLCGLSMGGYIALRAAERQPERVRGLVLCDTKSGADSDEVKVKRSAAIRGVKKDGLEKFAADFVKNVLSQKTLSEKPELVKQITDTIRAGSPAGLAGALLAMAARTDTTAALAKMNFPALILVGQEDKVTPPSAAEAMQKGLTKSTMHVIPGAAHFSNLENSPVFNEKLLTFLSSI